MRTDTCNKPHTLRDAVTGRNRNYPKDGNAVRNVVTSFREAAPQTKKERKYCPFKSSTIV